MVKIIRLAKKYWYMIVMILFFLLIQAFCELSLPMYTSRIVDVGIQYGGIDPAVPSRMRAETYQTLLRMLDQEGGSLLEQAYFYQEESKTFVLELSRAGISKEGEEAFLKDLEACLLVAQSALYQFTQNPENHLAFYADEGEDQGRLKEYAVAFVRSEYEALGMDPQKLQMDYLKNTGLKMAGLAFLAMLVAVMVSYLAARLAANTARDIRNQVFEKVVSFSSAELDRFSTASLITRCTNDIQQIQMVLVMIFRMIAYAPIMGAGGIIMVIRTGTSMSWIIAVAVGAVLILVASLMMIAMPKFKMMQTLVDRLNLVSREILTGISVIRAFTREEHEKKRFGEASLDLMKTQLFTNRTMAFMMPTMMFIMNGITVLILWVGAHGIDMGSLQVGDMMAFITYTMQIVMSFLMLTMISVMVPRAAVAADRINEVLRTEVSIHNPKEAKTLPEGAKGRIEFDHVCFRYPNAEEDVLSDLCFTAEAGATTAIIGSTGCGKSTLIQLIPRIYDVTNGAIRIDGADVRSLDLKKLRDMIGYVPQKAVLFSGTIKSNISFGSEGAGEQQIKEAAAIAQAEAFIESKPEAYSAPIAQGGSNVSGGQKQRLSIARAIAKDPQIYIFDDSFSALDYQTDIALRKALKEKTRDGVVLIVAQRISTILHADKIIVLDDGKIAGIGTHEKLLQENEVYQQIASSQLSQSELGGGSIGKEGA